MRAVFSVVASVMLATACGTDGGTGTSVDPSVETSIRASGAPSEPDPQGIAIDGAIAMNIAGGSAGDPVVAWSTLDSVTVARLDLASFTLGTPIDVSGDLEPVAHAIERPAVSIGDDDVVHVAFTSFVGAAGTVQYVDVFDEEPTEPMLISGEPRPETNLVHMTLADAEPALAWLEDSTLSVAMQLDGVPSEIENVDELTCDCCNPVPVRLGDQLTVAYRNLERTPDGVVRDIFSTTSHDGVTFEDPVLVSDDHWYLDGCPFSGPAVVRVEDELVVAWMDGRQSVHPDQDETTIWVDRSSDGARSFGPDLAVTDGGIHRWPSIVLDGDGTLHLIWETQASDGGISYSSSTDGGLSFDPPTLLIPNTDASGPRRSPSAIAHGGHLLVTWVDRAGGHLAGFDFDDVAP